MWETLIIEPILNSLLLLYKLASVILPSSWVVYFAWPLAIILLTGLSRWVLWPTVKKQVGHIKAIREVQPEIKNIKKQSLGRQAEQLAIVSLYKQKNINILAPLGYFLLQAPVFFGFFLVIRKIADPTEVWSGAIYGFVNDLGGIPHVATVGDTFFGLFSLKDTFFGSNPVVWGAFFLALFGAALQYYTAKQLTQFQQPTDSSKKQKTFRQVMREMSEGKEVDQSEMSALMSRKLIYLLPVVVFIFSLGWAAAVPFYWTVNNIITYYQQKRAHEVLLKKSPTATKVNAKGRQVVEAKVVESNGTQDDSDRQRPLNAKEKRRQQK